MIFDTVNSVLTDLDAAGKAKHGDDWEAELEARVETLSSEYQRLRDRTRELIDYSEITTQAAYTFMYVAGHASFIAQILKRAREENGEPLFSKKRIVVTSLGGGPGSELLGLVEYLRGSDEPVRKIKYWVLEKEAGWEHLTQAICDAANDRIEVELEFRALDVADTDQAIESTLEGDDLVIMSFFISEVCATKDGTAVRASLHHLLSTMSHDALLLYNDSAAYTFYSFFNDRTAVAKNFNQFLEIKEELSVAPEFAGITEEYMEITGKCPKLSSNALAKVLRRELP